MNYLTDTFLTLAKIDSPTGYEAHIADYVYTYCKQRNLFVEKDPWNNVFVKTSGVGEALFLSAHMDTVEPGRSIKPFVKNDVIVSDGTTIIGADNKSTITVLLALLDHVVKKKNVYRPLEILFTTGEEDTNAGAKHFAYSQVTAKKGIIADISKAIGSVVLASPAYVRFTISCIGKAGHAAFPDQANSILPFLVDFLSQAPLGKRDEHTIINIGRITAGTARNTIPGTVICEGEMRSFNEKDLAKYQNHIVQLCKALSKKAIFTIQTHFEKDNEGYTFTKSNPLIKEIMQTFFAMNINTTYVKAWSCSDANIFNQKGLTVVNIGDGTKHTHTVEETIAIADMQKLFDFLLRFISPKPLRN